MAQTPFRLDGGRLLVALKVQPGASANAIARLKTLEIAGADTALLRRLEQEAASV